MQALAYRLGFMSLDTIGSFELAQSYAFKDSTLIQGQPSTIWDVKFIGRAKRAKRDKEITGEFRRQLLEKLAKLLPSVLYFPNFLFDFPDRIYLEPTGREPQKHEFYRTILQDVLDSIGEHANLNDHVLKRAKSGNQFEKKALDSVLLKMGSNITTTVFRNWNRIFKRPAGDKEIVVNIDVDDDGLWYLELRLKDSNDYYTISERSLGFRWFFTFLLLTQYRGFRKSESNNPLFLFDEPASNLHPSAQSQLLESFGKFPGQSSIIYTTHSHHMINPNWLEGAFVVKNEGLDYESEQDEYTARKTIVTLHRYRKFAAEHPHQSTYFQPVLDVLDYKPGLLENIPSVVMLEGKNDFYALKLFQLLLKPKSSLNLLPGSGAGGLDDAIRMYLAWGKDFVVLLDSDAEGVRQKQRYIDLFGTILKERIFSLSDVDDGWKKQGMESLFDEEDRNKIQKLSFPQEDKYKKHLFNRSIQELLATNGDLSFVSDPTKIRLQAILEFCEQKLMQNAQMK